MLSICDQLHGNWYENIYNSYYPNSPHNSKHLFDIYTLSHIFWSALLVIILKKIFNDKLGLALPIGVFLLTTYFEIHENTEEQIVKYRRIEIDSSGTSYRGDSLINLIGDIIGNIIGIYLGLALSNQAISIVLVILFLVITNIVGFSYWLEFFEFLFKS